MDLWYKNFDNSIEIIAVIGRYNNYEVRRTVKVQIKLDRIKSISGLSFELNNGRPVVKFDMKNEMNKKGRIIGRFDIRDDTVSKAKQYMKPK